MRISLAAAAAALLALATASPAGAAPTGHFTVTDELAADEIGENTDIYVDGQLLAHVRLDHDQPQAAVAGAVPDAAGAHPYALCGDITFRDPSGHVTTHEVNATGTLSDLDGRHFQALGASDFTFFYLADPAPGRVPTAPSRDRSALCHPPVS